MASRILIVCVLALTIVCAAAEDVQSDENPQDLIQCNSKPGDITLTESEVIDAGHYLGEVGIDFTFPAKGSPQNKVINCVKVIDNIPDGGGGTSSITSGGLGQKFVTIHLESKISKGIDVTINISGQ